MRNRKLWFQAISKSINFLIVLAFLLGSAALPVQVSADSVITVNSTGDDFIINGFCSLREAITNANNNAATKVDCAPGSGNDTIVFSNGGGLSTIILGSMLPAISDPSGLTIDGNNNTTISGNDGYRVFEVSLGASLSLQKIIVAHGMTGYGGGLYNLGTVNIHLSSFMNNSAITGGAIHNFGNLTITNSSFSNNSATQDGGVILNAYGGVLNISNSLFWDNHATGIPSTGGVILNGGTANISVSDFTNNSALNFGGGLANTGELTIDGSTFVNNQVTEINSSGGGVELNGGEVNILRSAFSGNHALNDGGAVGLITGTLNVTNSTFSGNSANVGGAVSNGNGVATLLNNTFTGNSALTTQGADFIGWNASVTTIKNSILANSVAGNNCDLGITASVTGSNNIIESTPSCGSISTITSDPKLGAASGSPFYYTLYPGSPAVNAGDDTTCLLAPVNSTSQNGAARPQGAHCDIGAVEKTAIFNDISMSHWANPFIERLYMANISGGCNLVPLNYCPNTVVTRAQMAIFLLRGMNGSSYVPPAATGLVFGDVSVSTFGAAWIEQLAAAGITSGCGGGNYCPTQAVTRSQMAIFLVKAMYGNSYTPPAATGLFSDVPVGSFGASYIEKLVTDGITSGCTATTFCPSTTVKRDQMAVFLVRAFNLP